MTDQEEYPEALSDLYDLGTHYRNKQKWDKTQGEMLGVDMVVFSYYAVNTQKGNGLMLEVEILSKMTNTPSLELKVLITSIVLIDQLQFVRDDLPLRAKITRKNNYYTF